MFGSRRKNQSAVAAVLCLFLAFAYAVSTLKTYPIENDEFRTLNHIEPVWSTQARSIPATIRSVAALSPQHGPVYFISLNVWHKLAGSDLFSLRLLSTFFCLLALAMVYRLATITRKRNDPIVAMLTLSLLAFYMFYVQNLRMYTLLSFVSGWALWSYWKASRTRSPRAWVWISLFASIALVSYTHILGSLIVAAIGVYHVVFAKRDRRWRQVLIICAAAAALYMPWMPVVIAGLTEHNLDSGAAAARFAAAESVYAIFSILSNGAPLLPPLVAGLLLARARRLANPEKYLVFVVLLAATAMVVLNEFVPLIVENRMRYTIIIFAPYCCLVAIGLRQLPLWERLRFPALVLWCLLFFNYMGTEAYEAFTNMQQHETRKIPRYQDFIYEAASLPGYNELILSFHPNMVLSASKTLEYYRKALPDWAYIVHMTYDAEDELLIQSNHARYNTLDAIVANNNSVWVIHNPRETSLNDLPVYTNWLIKHFKQCIRYRDAELSAIDYYVQHAIPCELIASEAPVTVSYDNGTELANALVEQLGNKLHVFLRWGETIEKEYSLSLQVFDQKRNKVRQLDAVISGGPLDAFAFDLAGLKPGAYSVELIVYNFASGISVPGLLVAEDSRFERAISLQDFSVTS